MKTSIQTYLETRKSAKEFVKSGNPITEEQRTSILTAGLLCPTSYNAQPFRLVWITERELAKMPNFIHGKQQENAQGMLVALSCVNQIDDDYPGDSVRWYEKLVKKRPHHVITKLNMLNACKYAMSDEWAMNQTFAIMNPMIIAAAELGIASCPIGGFKHLELTDILKEHAWFRKPKDCLEYEVAYVIAFGRTAEPTLTTVNNEKQRHFDLIQVI